MIAYLGQYLSKHFVNKPIFIVGAGRSGTSVLLQALGQHPSIISFPGESPFLTSIGGNATLFNENEASYYCNAIRISYTSMMAKLKKLGFEVSGGEYWSLKNTLKHRITHRQITNRSIQYWSAKTFPTELVSNGLDSVYPGAKYLYIVRNGIEVVHSMTKFHGFKENDFISHCKTWSESVSKYEYLLTRSNALLVRHEMLSRDPGTTFAKVYKFLNLDNQGESACFTQTNVIHPLDKTDIHTKNSQALLAERENPIDLWDNQQRRIFSDICGNQMQQLGYNFTP